MDTTDLTNRTEIENEQEELNEAKRADEEDNGYDVFRNMDKIEDQKFKWGEPKQLTEEQLYNFRQQNIKILYAVLYSMGLNTEQLREKLDLISRFFGNIGGVSNISDEELCVFSHMIDDLKTRGYKFTL